MAEYTRGEDPVIDLTMGVRTDYGTTSQFFTRGDFLKVRNGLDELHATRDGNIALGDLLEGKPLSAGEEKLLNEKLGSFGARRDAVSSVEQWVKGHKGEVPEALLRGSDGRPLFQSELRDAAGDLAKIEKAHPGTVALLLDVDEHRAEAGKVLAQQTIGELKRAGMIDGRDQATPAADFLLHAEGSKFLKLAGLATPQAAPAAATAANPVTATAVNPATAAPPKPAAKQGMR